MDTETAMDCETATDLETATNFETDTDFENGADCEMLDEFLPIHTMLEVSLVEENRIIESVEDDPVENEAITSQSGVPDIVAKCGTPLDTSTSANSLLNTTIEEDELQFYNRIFKDISLVKYLRIHCTVCDAHIGCAPHSSELLFHHRILRVVVCQSCYTFYGSGEFSQGEDGSDIYCRWCGQGGQLLLCSNCTNAFCKKCIRRNYTKKILEKIEESADWFCLVCNYRSLWEHRAMCWAANRYMKMEKEEWNSGKGYPKEVYGPDRPLPGFDPSFCCQVVADGWAKKIRPFHSSMPYEDTFYSVIRAAMAKRSFYRTVDDSLITYLTKDLELKNNCANMGVSPHGPPVHNYTTQYSLINSNSPTNVRPFLSHSRDHTTNTSRQFVVGPMSMNTSSGTDTRNWHSPQTLLSNLQNTVQPTNSSVNLGPSYQKFNKIYLQCKQADSEGDLNKPIQTLAPGNGGVSRLVNRSNFVATDRNGHVNNNQTTNISSICNSSITSQPGNVSWEENNVPAPVVSRNSTLVNIAPKLTYTNCQNNTITLQHNGQPSRNIYQNTDIPQTNKIFISRNRYLNSSIPQANRVTSFNRYLNIPQRNVFRVYRSIVTNPNQFIRLESSQRSGDNPPIIQIDDNDAETINIDDDHENVIVETDPLNISEGNQTDTHVGIMKTVADVPEPVKEINTASTETNTVDKANIASDVRIECDWLKSSLQNADSVSRIMASRILEMKKKCETLMHMNDINGLKIITKKLHRLFVKATERILKLDLEVLERNKKLMNSKTDFGEHQGTNKENSIKDCSTSETTRITVTDSPTDSATVNKSETGVSLDMEISYESDHENNVTSPCENLICSTPVPTNITSDDWGSLSGDDDCIDDVLNFKKVCFNGGGDKKSSDEAIGKEGTSLTQSSRNNCDILKTLLQDNVEHVICRPTHINLDIDDNSNQRNCIDKSVQTDSVQTDSEHCTEISKSWSMSFDQFLSKKNNSGTVKHQMNCSGNENEALSTALASDKHEENSKKDSGIKFLKIQIKKLQEPIVNTEAKSKSDICKVEPNTAHLSHINKDSEVPIKSEADYPISVQVHSLLKRKRSSEYSKGKGMHNSECNGSEIASYKKLLLNPLYAKPCYVKLLKFD